MGIWIWAVDILFLLGGFAVGLTGLKTRRRTLSVVVLTGVICAAGGVGWILTLAAMPTGSHGDHSAWCAMGAHDVDPLPADAAVLLAFAGATTVAAGLLVIAVSSAPNRLAAIGTAIVGLVGALACMAATVGVVAMMALSCI